MSSSSSSSSSSPPVAPSVGSYVIPGDVLCSLSSPSSGAAAFSAGLGTYELDGRIYAALTGRVIIKEPREDEKVKEEEVAKHGKSLPLVCVMSSVPPTILPSLGDYVLCKVSRINPRFASVDIIAIQPNKSTDSSSAATDATSSSSPADTTSSNTHTNTTNTSDQIIWLRESLQGTIRQRDVRSFEIDSVEIYKSYRPNDVVRAQVLSLGDARSYYLSTASNELGVILSLGPAGVPMVPLSWAQMQCPLTGTKEWRKVAKPADSKTTVKTEEKQQEQ